MIGHLLGRRRAGDGLGGCRGVTIVELIAIGAVMAILAAFAIPGFSPVLLHYRVRGAAWQVAGDLRLARQRAVTLKQRFRVCATNCEVAVSAGSYSVERDQGTPSSPLWVSDTGVATRLPRDVTVSTTGTPVFSANGMASGGTFTLSNVMGTYQVAVASTGRVRVCEGTCAP
jgi:Tfp pilus assembly protein FimT